MPPKKITGNLKNRLELSSSFQDKLEKLSKTKKDALTSFIHFDDVDAVINWTNEQEKGHKFKIGFTGFVVKIVVDPSPTPKWGRIQ